MHRAARALKNYPLLGKLSRVYAAIGFYLDNQAEIDVYIQEAEREIAISGVALSESDPALWERLQQARVRAAQLT